MKSAFGAMLALFAIAAFAVAEWISVHPGASWLDSQYLFLVAAPYNIAMLRLTGETRFAPDQTTELVKAAAFLALFGYVAGALAEAVLRALWRLVRPRGRA